MNLRHNIIKRNYNIETIIKYIKIYINNKINNKKIIKNNIYKNNINSIQIIIKIIQLIIKIYIKNKMGIHYKIDLKYQ